MKTTIHNFIFAILLVTVFACGSDDDAAPAGGSAKGGTYAGYLQVVDDPQTDLGYILNAKVAVSFSGNTATVKITGNPGFDREYTGTVGQSVENSYMVTLNKQTKPTEKTVGDRLVVSDNNLTISINIANDQITVFDEPTSTATKTISGKISMIGTDMLIED